MKRWNANMIVGLWVVLVMAAGVRAETVAELVKRMPLQAVQTNTVTCEALLALGADGLAELAGKVQPPAVGGDAQARYLVSGITFYAARPEVGEARSLVEQAWLAALAGAEHREVKAFFMRRLQPCGTAASRDALAGHLSDSTLTEPAAQALLAIAAPGTAARFLIALKAGQGDIKTIVQALGILAHDAAAEPIRALAASEDLAIQAAALDALAAIGPVKRWLGWDHDSYVLLSAACQTTNRYARSQALGRCVRYAEKAHARGASKPAALAVHSLLAMSRERGESAVQAAALALWVAVNRREGIAAVTESVHSDDRALSIAGIKLLMRLGDDADDHVAEIVTSAAPHVRVAALDVLVPGVSPVVTRAVLAAVSETDTAVRIAAVSAAARLADRAALPTLLSVIDPPDPAVLSAVQDALLRVAMPPDMARVATALPVVAPAARVMLLKVLAERHAADQWDAVLAATVDPDPDVQRAAYKALGTVGTTATMPQLVSLYLAGDNAKLKHAASRAVVSVARAEPDAAKRYVTLLDAYDKGDTDARQAVLEVLPAVAGQPALDKVVLASRDADADLQAAGIRALAAWPDDSAAEAMLAALVASRELSQQVQLVRGLTRVVHAGRRQPAAKLALYRDTLAAAPRAEERNMVLGVVAHIQSRAALDLAAAHLDDPKLQASAARVVALSACPQKKYAGLKDPALRPLLVKAAPLLTDKKLKDAVTALVATMPAPEVPATPVAEAGFTPLFNGTDLAGWIGDTKGYIVQDGTIICKPGGNLYTAQEYSDFVLRFEFQLTAGANNGLGIRTPAKGNAAYAGMELQILDNTAPKYANLKPWQFHASIYGLVPAKRGHLKPLGEWNVQEVTAEGSKIKVVLNGTTIVDTDLATLAQTSDIHSFSKHPGMRNTTGHIGFLGHGSVVAFRNLRIKELKASGAVMPPEGFTALFNGNDLSGWWGLGTEHYKKYRGLSPEDLEARKAKSREDIQKHWRVEHGELVNDGRGLYLTTDKFYGDLEFRVDYKTVPRADSGIYLRGCPQVQIWDFTEQGKFGLGADKGSGGLWNNAKGAPGKDPLVLADKPFGEWNSFRIKMVGDKVTVHLNDQLVVDNATLHNYFDRKSPVPETGPIQLQTHGGEIRWRNVFIREL